MKNNKKNLEIKLNYIFKEQSLLTTALTHASIEHEMKEIGEEIESNQRLEFLGDAILDAIIGEELYKKIPNADEGELTKCRARIVCQDGCAKVGSYLELGTYLEMTKGEERSGGRQKKAIIADAVEAIIGAIYLDSNYEEVSAIVLRMFETEINNALLSRNEYKDYKSKIQEEIQGLTQYKGRKFNKPITSSEIRYTVIKESGPAHDKTFWVKLEIEHIEFGVGEGKSKKEAEQQAAKVALS